MSPVGVRGIPVWPLLRQLPSWGRAPPSKPQTGPASSCSKGLRLGLVPALRARAAPPSASGSALRELQHHRLQDASPEAPRCLGLPQPLLPAAQNMPLPPAAASSLGLEDGRCPGTWLNGNKTTNSGVPGRLCSPALRPPGAPSTVRKSGPWHTGATLRLVPLPLGNSQWGRVGAAEWKAPLREAWPSLSTAPHRGGQESHSPDTSGAFLPGDQGCSPRHSPSPPGAWAEQGAWGSSPSPAHCPTPDPHFF